MKENITNIDFEINSRLKEIREILQLTQKDFSKILEVKQSYYSDVENGKREVTTKLIKNLVAIFKFSADWIFTGLGNKNITDVDITNSDTKSKIASKNSNRVSPQQSRLLFISNDKVLSYVENINDDLKGLYNLIGDFETFRQVSKELSEAYFEKLYDIVFDDGSYFDGDKYRLEDCKKDAYNELRTLKPLESALKNLNVAIFKFYKEFNQVDSKEVIKNSIGDHVI